MKKILEIFKYDVSNLLKSKIALIIIIGIMIIPGIYAWLNIDSNWGPYDNTGNLPIAVVNKDKGITILGEKVSIGDEIEKSLKSNTAMKWVFTNEHDAIAKVKEGKYYGCIIIPKNFSNKLTTLVEDGKIEKPKFNFYVNDKKNPIAPIIVNKAVGTIQNSVNQAFVEKIIYKFVDAVEDIDVASKNETAVDDVIGKLNNAKAKVQDLRVIVQTTNLAANSTSKSLSAVRQLLPKVSDISGATKEQLVEIRNATKSFTSIADSVKKDISTTIDDTETIMNNLVDNITNTNMTNIDSKKDEIIDKLDKIIVVLKRLDTTLTSINSVTNLPETKKLESKVKEQITKMETIKNMVNTSPMTLSNLNEIKEKINESKNEISAIKKQYKKTVKDEISNLYKNAAESVNNSTDTLLNLNVSLDNVDIAMKYMIDALNNGDELSGDIDKILEKFELDIDKIIETIQETRNNEIYSNFIKLLKNKPEDIADFISSPVENNEKVLYSIETYGSKMSPFYSILACWVGCTLLTAILKINIKESKITKKAKNYQKFFGRFMLFGIIAMIQGLIIGIGDIILQVQTTNAFLFLITLMLSSLIFVLIIYSLAISFGKIGQALSIVIMVLQVAGSGGTFPIELLPRPFQILQPFMPFYPAMNAVRETIGGFYKTDYIKYILILLCHMIIPLILGLVLSKQTSKIKEKLEKELEKTGVIG